MSEEIPATHEETKAEATPKAPSLFRNYISFTGTAIVIASLFSIVVLFLIEFTRSTDNPYLGIVTYIFLPSIMAFGMAVVLLRASCGQRGRNPRRPAIIIAAAAMFDIHIESTAVAEAINTSSAILLPLESLTAICAIRASMPYRLAATLKVNPPRKSARTGSAAQPSTRANRNSSPKDCSKSGVNAQSTNVGT